jgi:hypothetical protein
MRGGRTKTWIYGALRVRDGKELTRCAPARNSKNYIALLAAIEADNPKGDLYLITDNLSSHNSLETRTWMEAHPRLHHVFIPTGACWLNLQEGCCAAVQARGLRRAELCQSSRDRPGAAGCDLATQPPRSPLGVGTTIQNAAPSPTSLLLSYLRNVALVLQPHLRDHAEEASGTSGASRT